MLSGCFLRVNMLLRMCFQMFGKEIVKYIFPHPKQYEDVVFVVRVYVGNGIRRWDY